MRRLLCVFICSLFSSSLFSTSSSPTSIPPAMSSLKATTLTVTGAKQLDVRSNWTNEEEFLTGAGANVTISWQGGKVGGRCRWSSTADRWKEQAASSSLHLLNVSHSSTGRYSCQHQSGPNSSLYLYVTGEQRVQDHCLQIFLQILPHTDWQQDRSSSQPSKSWWTTLYISQCLRDLNPVGFQERQRLVLPCRPAGPDIRVSYVKSPPLPAGSQVDANNLQLYFFAGRPAARLPPTLGLPFPFGIHSPQRVVHLHLQGARQV